MKEIHSQRLLAQADQGKIVTRMVILDQAASPGVTAPGRLPPSHINPPRLKNLAVPAHLVEAVLRMAEIGPQEASMALILLWKFLSIKAVHRDLF